jgi:hypothetical protein
MCAFYTNPSLYVAVALSGPLICNLRSAAMQQQLTRAPGLQCFAAAHSSNSSRHVRQRVARQHPHGTSSGTHSSSNSSRRLQRSSLIKRRAASGQKGPAGGSSSNTSVRSIAKRPQQDSSSSSAQAADASSSSAYWWKQRLPG